jgi:hypothetical protein
MFKQTAASLFLLALALQVNGHALIEPALGIPVGGTRNDVTRPSQGQPCGKGVNVQAEIAGTTAVQANPDGSFVVNISNFNKNIDGSRKIVESNIDATATGQSFNAKADITQNGDLSSKTLSTQQLTVQMPAGTTCTGGTDGASCVVSFKTAGGFGNCVLVSQAASTTNTTAAAAAAVPPAAAVADGADATDASATSAATDATASTAATTTTDNAAAAPAAPNTSAIASLLASNPQALAALQNLLGATPPTTSAVAASPSTAPLTPPSALLGGASQRRAVGTRIARPLRAVVEARKVAEGLLL